jgi:AcrR family transcriptional regulator
MARQSSDTSTKTRDRLIAAATRLFVEKGYEATSIADLETAVGLIPRRGTLYKHFASKEDLLTAVVNDRVGQADAFLAAAKSVVSYDLSTLTNAELAEIIREFGRGFLVQLDNHRDLTRIVEHEGDRLPELKRRIRVEVIAPGYRAVTRVLKQLAPPDTDAAAHAALLLTALTGLRRTEWTFGSETYRLSDARAINAWTLHCLAVLRPNSTTADGHARLSARPLRVRHRIVGAL